MQAIEQEPGVLRRVLAQRPFQEDAVRDGAKTRLVRRPDPCSRLPFLGAPPRPPAVGVDGRQSHHAPTSREFVEAVQGMGDACRTLETPITGGNVSFYNQTGDVAVHPTPVVGVLGGFDPNDYVSERLDAPARDGVAVARINDTGLRVSGVSRNVYLGLASDLNAELRVGNTTAGVSNKIDGLALASVGPSNYSARLGSGGPRIEVSNVTGFIVLQRI